MNASFKYAHLICILLRMSKKLITQVLAKMNLMIKKNNIKVVNALCIIVLYIELQSELIRST